MLPTVVAIVTAAVVTAAARMLVQEIYRLRRLVQFADRELAGHVAPLEGYSWIAENKGLLATLHRAGVEPQPPLEPWERDVW